METLVLSDPGSGLKASRRQLPRLLKLVCEDKVGEIAIAYEDRLTRLGQEYLQTLFACFDMTLTVREPGEEKRLAQASPSCCIVSFHHGLCYKYIPSAGSCREISMGLSVMLVGLPSVQAGEY